MKKPMIDYMQSVINDNLYTPYGSILPLIRYIKPNQRIWECCDCGKSKISEVLRDSGHTVYSSDIVNGFNFLKDKPSFDFDMIITNPPYSIKDDFIEMCYEYNKPWALLLPLTALEGVRRGDLFRKFGISVIVFDRRADFTGKGRNWFNSSWFCWNIIPNNTLIFKELEE